VRPNIGTTTFALLLAGSACQHQQAPTPATAEVDEPTQLAPLATEGLCLDEPTLLWDEPGLRVETQAWYLGEDQGTAWRVRTPVHSDVRVVPSDRVVRLADLAPDEPGPWAAINGGFYEVGAMGLVVADGNERSPLTERGGSGVFLVDEKGPRVVHRSDWEPGPSQALQSLDRLVDGGLSVWPEHAGAPRAARSAVAISEDALWLVVAVDRRSIPDGVEPLQLTHTVGYGLPGWAFAELLVQGVGAQQALNMDGAISTQLEVVGTENVLSILGQSGTINAIVVRPGAHED